MKETISPAELCALKQEIFSSLHCALPGFVESFDVDGGTAVIRPALRNKEGAALPLLYDVPVFMPVSFDIHPGDACLLVFADCDIDAWFETGNVEVPVSSRKHSLSDALAFVGFRTAVQKGEA